jgi:adenine phosphoribosyltransferase
VDLSVFIRDIPDYPKPGILFKDITPLLRNPKAFREVITRIYMDWRGHADVIVGLDARGFIFGGAAAFDLGLPFVPMRKKGKLPFDTVGVDYALEYGVATAEMHTDAIKPGDRVLIVDDLLATGGTANAACHLVSKLGGTVAGCVFVIELGDLDGRVKLPAGVPIQSMITYKEGKILLAA